MVSGNVGCGSTFALGVEAVLPAVDVGSKHQNHPQEWHVVDVIEVVVMLGGCVVVMLVEVGSKHPAFVSQKTTAAKLIE